MHFFYTAPTSAVSSELEVLLRRGFPRMIGSLVLDARCRGVPPRSVATLGAEDLRALIRLGQPLPGATAGRDRRPGAGRRRGHVPSLRRGSPRWAGTGLLAYGPDLAPAHFLFLLAMITQDSEL
ncbi:MAG: hypothetical protein ACRDTF_12705 [Pseudonocardiaceae bacterium]